MSQEDRHIVKSSAAESIPVTLIGFADEETARTIGNHVGIVVYELGRLMNLASLEGIIISYDYEQSLRELDRGVKTFNELKPSRDWAYGVAMTPVVLRDGEIKSVIVLNAAVAEWFLKDFGDPDYREAFHAIAHECAHVELNSVYDQRFPGITLRHVYTNAYEGLVMEVANACWNEYGATRLCAAIGADPTSGYEDIFLTVLGEARENVRQAILKYRVSSGDADALEILVNEGERNINVLMKYSSYVLGNNDGYQRNLYDQQPKFREALEGHWFKPFFDELHGFLKQIYDEYPDWSDMSKFEAIGGLVAQVWANRGLHISARDSGEMYVDVPMTSETNPLSEAIRRLTSFSRFDL